MPSNVDEPSLEGEMDDVTPPPSSVDSTDIVVVEMHESNGQPATLVVVNEAVTAGNEVIVNPALADDKSLDAVSLSWKRLNVSVELPKPSIFERRSKRADRPTHKSVLKNVSGTVRPGTLIAIMGASGAGKTTLMNVLAHQDINTLDIEGSIEVNGKYIGKQIKTISAYVRQEDLFIGTLTVREHLLFQAYLRMESKCTDEQKVARVDSVISELGLNKCQDTIIGIPGRIRGISGGEMKRLSFASEIITNPSLLFVDEPTSGLDSFMAENVVASLQRMAAHGKTILATIHQPSSEIFQMFDSLLLLSEGRVAYMGPRSEALPYFARLGFQCPQNFNPADFYISTLAIKPGIEDESKERSGRICDFFESDRSNGRKISEMFVKETVIEKPDYKAGPLRQFRTVLWRCWTSDRREPYVTKIKMFQSLVIGVVAGLIYLQQDNDQDSIKNFNGFMFFILTTLTFNSVMSALFVFPAELPVFLKDHRMGMYRPSIYFISKTLAELPWYTLGTLLMAAVSYWMVGLRSDADAFFLFCALSIMTTYTALSFGYLISTISPSVQVATALGPPLVLPFLLFGGFFIKDSTVPVYFVWLKYLSWFRYTFEAFNINQWDGFGSINCKNGTMSCLRSGQAVLEDLDFDADDFGFDFGLLFALMFGFRILAYIVLLIRTKRK